jgi:hypothetical protein
MFTVIVSSDATIAINLNQVAAVRLGTPDEGTKWITFTRTEVELATGTKYLIDQEDEVNYDFLCKVFGFDWQKHYKAIPIFEELLAS